MKKISIATILVAAALSLSACGASTSADGTDSNAIPQADAATSAAKVTPAAPAPAAPAAEPAPAEPKASTCDVAREAILSENKATIEKSLKALQKDKKADATAREAAQEYFQQDNADLKKMQLDLIQMACTF